MVSDSANIIWCPRVRGCSGSVTCLSYHLLPRILLLLCLIDFADTCSWVVDTFLVLGRVLMFFWVRGCLFDILWVLVRTRLSCLPIYRIRSRARDLAFCFLTASFSGRSEAAGLFGARALRRRVGARPVRLFGFLRWGRRVFFEELTSAVVTFYLLLWEE